jgi:CheY-like chemotaxis protein
MDERKMASDARSAFSFYRALAYERILADALLSLIGALGAMVWLVYRLREARRQAEGNSGSGLATISSDVERQVDHSVARVLVADDNAVNQRAVVRMLGRVGLRADVSVNGREAAERVRSLGYDLVLMDCQMPIMNGHDAATEIRKQEPADRHTPIVAMTADADGDCLNRCLESGMDDLLLKPIRMEELTALLCRWLPSYQENDLPVGSVRGGAD